MIRAVRAGRISQGKHVAEFEEAVAEMVSAAGGVATNSGTSALILALRALGVSPGDEIITPTYTCVAILDSIVRLQAVPVLVDCTCDAFRMDYNISPTDAAAAVSARTAAIILPHMFGGAADVEEIRSLGVPVIEDITLSVGGRDPSGQGVGSVGDIAVCSFHASKMIVCGEGGMMLARDEALVTEARRSVSWEVDQVRQRMEGMTREYEPRYSVRMTDIQAACGMSQLARLGEDNLRRRALATRYEEALGDLDGLIAPSPEADPGHVYNRYIVSLREHDVVDCIREFAKEGIEAGRGVYPPLHDMLGWNEDAFPGAVRAVRSNLSIPMYPGLTESEVDRVLGVSRAILGAG